jgi:hypothetical protein
MRVSGTLFDDIWRFCWRSSMDGGKTEVVGKIAYMTCDDASRTQDPCKCCGSTESVVKLRTVNITYVSFVGAWLVKTWSAQSSLATTNSISLQ